MIGTDPLNWDTDGDGISDGDEYYGNVKRWATKCPYTGGWIFHLKNPGGESTLFTYRTNPLRADSDLSGQPDNKALIPLDFDMDGDGRINHPDLVDPNSPFYQHRTVQAINAYPYPILEMTECGAYVADPDRDGDGIPNIDDPDADGDGIPDLYELEYGVYYGGWQNPYIHNARYAIIIGGGATKDEEKKTTHFDEGTDKNYPAYLNGAVLARDKLAGYGYRPENIHVFVWDQAAGSSDGKVNGPALWGNDVEDAFVQIGEQITKNDFFYLQIHAHGGASWGPDDEPYFNILESLDDGTGQVKKRTVYSSMLNKRIDDTIEENYAMNLIVIQSCGCGNFMSPLSKPANRIVITAGTGGETTYVTSDYEWGEFLYHPRSGGNVDGFLAKIGSMSSPASIRTAFYSGCDGADRNTPRLDDNGDGVGGTKGSMGSDGTKASKTYL